MGAAAQTLAALRTAVARIEARETDGGGLASRVPFGIEAIDAALGGGLRRGALHAVTAAGPPGAAAATGFAAALAGRAAEKGRMVLWIRQDMAAREAGEPWGPGLSAVGLDPARVVMLRVRDVAGLLKAAEAGLSSAALAATVIEPFGAMTGFDLVAGRRLALAAARSGGLGLMLRPAPAPGLPAGFSAAETRWRIAPLSSDAVGAGEEWGRPLLRAELMRNRLGGLGRWPLAFGFDDGAFRLAERRFAGLDPRFGHDRGAAVAQAPRGRVSEPVDRPAEAGGTGRGRRAR